MRLKMDGGRDVQLDPREHPHLDHGYAVTSHSSQGQDCRAGIDSRRYRTGRKRTCSTAAWLTFAVSRGAEDAQLYTNDRAKLPGSVRA